MDEDELAFVIGHEMGHITLGHTWLNTILGGMAGIPASFGAAILLTVVFRSWNRACEYSADRAGMLACKNPSKAISALLKLVSGERSLDQVEMTDLIRVLDREDDNLDGQFSEILSSHPLVIKRINQIREYASSREYSNLLNSIR
jgi:Zn-dependent protease with chaperone function